MIHSLARASLRRFARAGGWNRGKVFGNANRSRTSSGNRADFSRLFATYLDDSPRDTVKKIAPPDLARMKKKVERISMVTAYDFPTAVHVDTAGVDIVLVGDSLGMVVMGHTNTLRVTVDDVIHHSKCVVRGVRRAMVVGDLPFGSYEHGAAAALATGLRFIKEAGVDAVKLEGGGAVEVDCVRALARAGIAVMGHIGLTPQRVGAIGGFRAQGRTAKAAASLVEQALRLQDAGAMSIVLECVPEEVGRWVTEQVEVPTIGIGAGPGTDGQVLVFHDMLGVGAGTALGQPPRFVKQYAAVGDQIQHGLRQYVSDVKAGTFPDKAHSPYKMAAGESIQSIQSPQSAQSPGGGSDKEHSK